MQLQATSKSVHGGQRAPTALASIYPRALLMLTAIMRWVTPKRYGSHHTRLLVGTALASPKVFILFPWISNNMVSRRSSEVPIITIIIQFTLIKTTVNFLQFEGCCQEFCLDRLSARNGYVFILDFFFWSNKLNLAFLLFDTQKLPVRSMATVEVWCYLLCRKKNIFTKYISEKYTGNCARRH